VEPDAIYVEDGRILFLRLDAGHSVTDSALRSGYGSPETLRSAFIQYLGVSPRSYHQRFHSAIRN
jgi:AraC-like DNA-binding protein